MKNTTERELRPGVNVPIINIFHPETEEVDKDAVAKHAVRMAKAGVSSITVNGSMGEAAHLLIQEMSMVVRIVRMALDAAGFGQLTVVAGCSAQSVYEATTLCKQAFDSGADYALLLPPSFYQGAYTEQDLHQYFTAVANASPMPIVIYNYPAAVAGIDLTSAQIIALSEHPMIHACKLTCGNIGKLTRIVRATTALTKNRNGTSVPWLTFSGLADCMVPSMVIGGSGVVAGLANIAPRTCVRVYDLWHEGSVEEARKLQMSVADADSAIAQAGIVGLKSAMQQYWGYGGFARRPLRRLSVEEKAKAADLYREICDIEESLADKS